MLVLYACMSRVTSRVYARDWYKGRHVSKLEHHVQHSIGNCTESLFYRHTALPRLLVIPRTSIHHMIWQQVAYSAYHSSLNILP